LLALKEEILVCSSCSLWEHYKISVPFEGNLQSKIMFIGRDPGKEETRLRRPFVGEAGEELDKVLIEANLDRENIYISNLVKCRPWKNIAPTKKESILCINRFLVKEIVLIQPKVIICLGRESANTILNNNANIGAMRGKIHKMSAKLLGREIPVVPTWHPSYLVRNKGKEEYNILRGQVVHDVLLACSLV